MKILYRLLALAAITSATFTSATAADPGRGFVETDLVSNLATLTDKNGVVHQAAHVDLNLRNPWGVGESPTTANGPGSPFWVSENNAGKSTLYDTHGIPQPAPPQQPLVVSIPAPGAPLGSDGTPTGLVFNIAGGAQGAFKISGFHKGWHADQCSSDISLLHRRRHYSRLESRRKSAQL